MPKTRSRGQPVTLRATQVMVSSGLATMIRIASGEVLRISSATGLTIAMFLRSRSSRDSPGLRGMPEVTTTTSEPRVASKPVLPVMLTSARGERTQLHQVERLALGEVGHDVDQHEVAERAVGEDVGCRLADAAGADDRDLLAHVSSLLRSAGSSAR